MRGNKSLTEKFYTATNLFSSITKALTASGKNIGYLTTEDLAPIDEFHIRGIKATKELAELSKINQDDKILDLGCGLGGSARYLASNYGCYVTGIDITQEYSNTAAELSKLVKLDDKTEFHHADAINLPFEKGNYDVVWSEHVQMNIENKQKLFNEIYRVLKPNGKLIFYDVFKGHAKDIYFPVPWAENSSTNFLSEQNDIKYLMETLHFKIKIWEDKTELSKNWFIERVSKMKIQNLPPLGLNLVMGENTIDKMNNMARNLNEEKLTVAQAVITKC